MSMEGNVKNSFSGSSSPSVSSLDLRKDVIKRNSFKRQSSASGLKVEGRSPLASRLSTFTNSVARQKFSQSEKRAISQFSSVNYAATHSATYMKWIQERGKTHWQADKWAACFLIGLFTGLVACLLKQSTEALNTVRWSRAKELIRDGRLLDAWGWNAGISCAFIIISSFFIVFIHPPAAGGGTAEVIAFLNGVIVHGSRSLKNLVVKFISLVFCVSSGATVGSQGPLISYGAIIGSGIGQLESKTLGFSPNLFKRFRNAEDRRELSTVGVAAGVSAGFNAPMGGLLFAMEDISSFWGKSLSWQVFFSAVVATAAAQLFNTAFTGFQFEGLFGAFNLSVVAPLEVHIAVLVHAVALGLVGGLLGALFTRLNTIINLGRKKMLASIRNDLIKKIVRILEAIFIALIMATYSIYLPSGFTCEEVRIQENQTVLLEECFYGGVNASLNQLEQYTCEDAAYAAGTTVPYNEVASLIQGGGQGYLDRLWSRGTHDTYGWAACLAVFAVWFFMSIFTAGAAVAGGIFLPVVISGALYGRAAGVVGIIIWRQITGVSVPVRNEWEWLDPGLISVLGSASLLGGVTRLALATTVIMVEMSDDLNIIIPVMLTIFVAKIVADTISKPLYKCQLDAKALPFLESELKVVIDNRIVNLELYKARDVMAYPVWTMHSCETVSVLARLLMETSHEGFPVVKYDDATRSELTYGLITRTELYVILCSKEVYDAKAGKTVTPDVAYKDLSVDYIDDPSAAMERVKAYCKFPVYSKIYVDLEPFINISAPKIDEDFSLQRTYQLFRTLGLRHLIVNDIRNHVVGIITRKDLMPYNIQDRLSACLPVTEAETSISDGTISSRTLLSLSSREGDNNNNDSPRFNGVASNSKHMSTISDVIAEISEVGEEVEYSSDSGIFPAQTQNGYVNAAFGKDSSTAL